jgi:hypothetical protein
VFDKLDILSRTELVHFALASRLFVRDPDAGDIAVEAGDGP